jgi:hypothetical protein
VALHPEHKNGGERWCGVFSMARKPLRLAIVAGIAMWALACTAAFAQTPTCNGKNVYPCSVGGTLLVLNKPTGYVLNFGSGTSAGAGTAASVLNDPKNPGFAATTTVALQAFGPVLPSLTNYTFSLTTVGSQPVIAGVSASIACGVTGGATYSLSLATPGGPLVLQCPHMTVPGRIVTVKGQIGFPPLSSLVLALTLSGTAHSSSDILTIGALSAQVQIPCGSAVSPGAQAFSPAGGSGNISITTSPGCAWGISGIPSWVTVTSTASGTGNGTLSYQVAADEEADRAATMTVANVSFTVEQEAASISGLVPVGSLAQVASEGGWSFELDAVNLGSSAATARLDFTDGIGSPLLMPLMFPQLAPAAAPELAATLDRTISPNARIVIDSPGPASGPTALLGSAQLRSNGNVSGFGIFSYPPLQWNAVVPLEARNASTYYLPFDNTGVLATGVALANITASATSVQVTILNDVGTQIGTDTINLTTRGYDQFMLNAQYVQTTGLRGTIRFHTALGGQISVLGVRANGPALTTLPVLSNVDSPGGSISHVTYHGGFTSTFYLVNTGSTPSSFTLSFFGQNGSPMNVPLSLPQSGTALSTSALTQTLAAGQMLEVATQAQDALVNTSGSAQLTTNGKVSGFEIFRWDTYGQEASVPLETRTSGSFVLVFDNTGGLNTGVALANVGASAASITANIYGDQGNLLQVATINLAGRTQELFMLPDASKGYPITAGKRGMVQFVVPPSGPIAVIGIRTSGATLTTVPILTK